MKRIDVAIAIVCRGGQVLICRRRDGDSFAGLWEFPGGKVEAGETTEQCLSRELKEELNITATPQHTLPITEHDYPAAKVRLHPFICRHDSGQPTPLGCAEAIWIDPPALRDFAFPAANKELIEQLILQLGTHRA